MELKAEKFHGKLKKRPSDTDSTQSPRKLDPFMRALKAFHSAGTPESMDPEALEKQRKNQELLGRLVAPMTGLQWEPFCLDGMNAAWARLDRPQKRRHCILYCHGGGYTSGNLGYSRVLASKLAAATGYEVLTFEYRLAPEHPYPAAIEDALKAWDHLMLLGYGARDVVVAGDSAGGNLAMVLCHRLLAAGRLAPSALALFSPWTDMTMAGTSYDELAELDPMLTREYIQTVRQAYAPGADYAAPDFSPLLGDLSDFPPTLLQVGTFEILLDDSRRLQEKLEAAHVPCRLEVYDDMWHVFQMFPIRKATQAIQSVAYFLLELD